MLLEQPVSLKHGQKHRPKDHGGRDDVHEHAHKQQQQRQSNDMESGVAPLLDNPDNPPLRRMRTSLVNRRRLAEMQEREVCQKYLHEQIA